MEKMQFQKDTYIAHKNDKVCRWYLIQQGSVIQRCESSKLKLEKNTIIGFPEKDIYQCDYIAAEDVVLTSFVCDGADDIRKILAGQEKVRNIFLQAALKQRHQLLCLYSELHNRTKQFRQTVETLHSEYKALCNEYRILEQPFPKIELFKPLEMQHKAESWEVANSISIIRTYMNEYIQLMEQDDSLTVGTIMEASAQMRRFMLGIGEMDNYLSYNRDILIGESQNNLYRIYFNLAVEMHEKNYPITPVSEKMSALIDAAEKTQLYNPTLLKRLRNDFTEYDYAGQGSDDNASKAAMRKNINIATEDCLAHILDYAGYSPNEIEDISKKFEQYRNIPDAMSSDKEAYTLRKYINELFYDTYYKVFIRAVENESSLTPILEMFLNFGFMDVSYVGHENANALYDLSEHLDVFNSGNIYTIYEWLKCVYNGKKETSKNDFDKNYPSYLVELYKTGKITKDEISTYTNDKNKRIEFEIQNMFTSVNKLTYGKIVNFCPILSENDLLNSIDKMITTAKKIQNALNEVRKVDFSIFYREVPFSDVNRGINSERVMREILPDIILMPNAGSKSMMWQETADIKTDTPARFMFPIFCSSDLSDIMLEAMGRYRWEMCRKVEGIHWNDVREKSLTAEYCSYLQFYRKDSSLSVDAKEKIKNTLQRVKNSYREVFVKDYISWIKYESKGSSRLNKITRDILVRHCSFAKPIRNDLRTNPIYQASITRFEADAGKKQLRYRTLINKYGTEADDNARCIKETLLYYDM